jgi:hypothetical protein
VVGVVDLSFTERDTADEILEEAIACTGIVLLPVVMHVVMGMTIQVDVGCIGGFGFLTQIRVRYLLCTS